MASACHVLHSKNSVQSQSDCLRLLLIVIYYSVFGNKPNNRDSPSRVQSTL